MVNDKLQPSDNNSALSSHVERNLGLCKSLSIVTISMIVHTSSESVLQTITYLI